MIGRQALPIISHEDGLSRLRRYMIRALALATMTVATIDILIQVFAEQAQRDGAALDKFGPTLVFLAVGVGVWLLVERGNSAEAATLLIALFVVAALFLETAFVLLVMLALFLAAALGKRWVYGLATLAIFGKALFEIAEIIDAEGTFTADAGDETNLALALIVVGIMMRYFFYTAEQTTTHLQKNSELLRATAEIGQTISGLFETGRVLEQAVDLIKTRFEFGHVQIFLVDEDGKEAVLGASTLSPETAQQQRKIEVGVGARSIVGQAVLRRMPILLHDSAYRADMSSGTPAEFAVPMADGSLIVGVLDIHADHQVFNAGVVQALQVMASQLAISVRNARLFEAQELNSMENRRLYNEAESNLHEIERLNRQLTKGGWDDYLELQPTVTGVSLRGGQLVTDVSWSDNLAHAARRGQPVSRVDADGRTVAVPIMLRGTVVGAMEVETQVDAQDAEMIEMMQSVAQRLALSLDNARLFEEAQRATAQEQRINEIVALFQSATSVEDLLRITLTELSDILGAEHGSIRLSSLQGKQIQGNTVLW